ncbi:MAG: (2Fe-2S)-binding protein [Desulfobacterales bacterium]|nr:(2Fe-2S)-binding protein [Desulfobacterales bacterium]
MNHTPELICYCFNYTAEDIHQDYEANGHSTILEQIKRERKSGNSACAEKNPKGR